MLCPECKKNGIDAKIEEGRFFCRHQGHLVSLASFIKISRPPRSSEIRATNQVANLFLYLFLTTALLFVAGTVLFFIGKLPPFIPNLVGWIVSVIGSVCTIVGISIGNTFFVRIWHFANVRRRMILLSFSTMLAFIIIDLFILVGWYPLLPQGIPYCDNSQGWKVPSNMQEGTPKPDCSSGKALGLYQYSPTRAHYAELDLNTVQGQAYSQTAFQVKVDVAFEKQDENTFGCIIVQTAVGEPGGYILCVNYLGYWKLENATNLSDPIIASNISTQPHQIIHLMVQVQYGQLYVFVNNQQVHTMTDTLSSGVVGLIVEKNRQTQSSMVFYSNFELDKAFIQ